MALKSDRGSAGGVASGSSVDLLFSVAVFTFTFLLPLIGGTNQPALWGLYVFGSATALIVLVIRAGPEFTVSLMNPLGIASLAFLGMVLFQILNGWGQAATLPTGSYPWPRSTNVGPSLDALFRYVGFAVAFFIGFHLADKLANIRVLLWAFSFSAAFYAVIGIFEGAGLFGALEDMGGGLDDVRISGPFKGSNAFAAYLGASSLAAAGLIGMQLRDIQRRQNIVSKKEQTRRLLSALLGPLGIAVILWILIFVGIAQTGSRGAMAATIISTLVATVAVGAVAPAGGRKTGLWVSAAFLGVVVLVFGVLDSIPDRLSVFSFVDPGREKIWGTALAAYSENWVWGYGAGNFPVVYPMFQTSFDFSLPVFFAHSNIIQLFVEHGIVGGLFMLAIVSFYLVRVSSSTEFGGVPRLLCLAMATYVLVHSAVDDPIATPANAFVVMTIFGLGYSRRNSHNPSNICI